MAESQPITTMEAIESLVAYADVLRDIVAALPDRQRAQGGRKAQYPPEIMLIYCALNAHWHSARFTEFELRWAWRQIRRTWHRRFPEEPKLSRSAPKRCHWQHFKRNLKAPEWAAMRPVFRFHAVDTAIEIGCFDPATASFTHPDALHVATGDGTVIPPLSDHAPGTTWTHPETGEIRARRSDPDAGFYYTGGAPEDDQDASPTKRPGKAREQALGLKVTHAACHNGTDGGTVLLDVDACAKGHGEMVFLEEFTAEVAPMLPGMVGVAWDAAGRGLHAEKLGRRHGKHLISKVSADSGGHTTGRPAIYKPWSLGQVDVRFDDGREESWRLCAIQGTPHLIDADVAGNDLYLQLQRTKSEARRDNGGYRMYNVYEVDLPSGRATVRLPLFSSEADRKMKINRSERLRSLPETDPDFDDAYAIRNMAEAVNAMFKATLKRGRARSLGAQANLLDWLGFALLRNAVARHRHRTALLTGQAQSRVSRRRRPDKTRRKIPQIALTQADVADGGDSAPTETGSPPDG